MFKTWKITDSIFGLLRNPARTLLKQPIRQRHPLMFYLFHVNSFAVSQLQHQVPSLRVHDRWDKLFVRGIDPHVDKDTCHTHSCPRDFEDWPSLEEALWYRDEVRARMREIFRSGLVTPWLLIKEHEMLHQETLLYMMTKLPLEDLKCGTPKLDRRGSRVSLPDCHVAGGWAEMGADPAKGFVWDNEVGEIKVKVAPFEMQALPLTNLDYYAYLKLTGLEQLPQQWSEKEGKIKVRELLTEYDLADRLHHPVLLSHEEAQRCLTDLGMTLLTEAEWTLAAKEHWPSKRHPKLAKHTQNFDFARLELVPSICTPRRSGAHDMVGNGWEWTLSQFEPFPNYWNSHPTYKDFSSDFMRSLNPESAPHMVLKGASWATRSDLVRPSFRNFFQPNYPHVLSKARGRKVAGADDSLRKEVELFKSKHHLQA